MNNLIKEYVKKPIKIQAVLHDGSKESKDFIIKVFGKNGVIEDIWEEAIGKELYIKTLEGTMIAKVGDYIIKGVQGELYPCNPAIFKKTYEEVKDDNEIYGKGIYW